MTIRALLSPRLLRVTRRLGATAGLPSSARFGAALRDDSCSDVRRRLHVGFEFAVTRTGHYANSALRKLNIETRFGLIHRPRVAQWRGVTPHTGIAGQTRLRRFFDQFQLNPFVTHADHHELQVRCKRKVLAFAELDPSHDRVDTSVVCVTARDALPNKGTPACNRDPAR